MKNLHFLPLLALALTGSVWQARAQSPYVREALNYSRLQFGGPARTQGIAGANVALGADFGNLSSNPAGLGLFQKSEVHLAPGIGLGTADANGLTADNNSLHIGSAGAVFTTRRADEETGNGWRGGSFAIGFTRLADFNSTFTYQGEVADNRSFFQRLREPGGNAAINSAGYQQTAANILTQYNGGTGSIYTNLDGLAYGAFLTDIDDSRGAQRSEVFTRLRSRAIVQGETVTTSGSLSQLDFGYGASYQDRLYVGGAVGIVSSRRTQTRSFTEAENDPTTRFASLRLDDEVRTTGSGLNARVGVIYRLTDAVRLGAAVQSPTFMRLTETAQTTLSSTFTPFAADTDPVFGATLSLQPADDYTYKLTTPFRASAGAAVTIGKAGFVTGDVEYVGYQQARLGSTDPSLYEDASAIADDNQVINSAYQGTVNLRLGAEARLDVFRVRAGFAHYGDPYSGGSTASRAQQFYTVGAGVRQRSFFIDLAGVYTTLDQQYSPYTLASGQQPVVKVQNSRYTTTVTAGLTF